MAILAPIKVLNPWTKRALNLINLIDNSMDIIIIILVKDIIIMNLLFSHMRVGKKLRESLALICIFVPTQNTPELIRSKFHNLDYTDFNRRAFVWFIFCSLLFWQKAPVHPDVQRKQAPLETLHIGSGQLSLHGLSQLLP